MNDLVDLPQPVVRLADATNSGNTTAFLEMLSDDVYIKDGEREFNGRVEAAAWNESDNIGVGAHLTLGVARHDSATDE